MNEASDGADVGSAEGVESDDGNGLGPMTSDRDETTDDRQVAAALKFNQQRISTTCH